MSAYKSKIGFSFWSHLLLVLVIITPVMIFTRSTIEVSVFASALLVLIVGYFALAAIMTKYTLESDRIVIRNAVSRYSIPYEKITKITDTDRNLLNYGIVVLSMDRIGINWGNRRHTLISPKNKEEVINSLRARCHNAEYAEDLKKR